jgi:hypothetical protein
MALPQTQPAREDGRLGGGSARRPPASRERGLAQKAEHACGGGHQTADAFSAFRALTSPAGGRCGLPHHLRSRCFTRTRR